jgi:hypothetical protein
MTDDRASALHVSHEISPGGRVVDRPREGATIPIILAVLTAVFVCAGLLYNGPRPTTIAQHSPPASTTTPDATPAPPVTQQPARSNAQGTQ